MTTLIITIGLVILLITVRVFEVYKFIKNISKVCNEVVVTKLIKKYEKRGLVPQERSIFLKTVAAILTGEHGAITE